MAETMTVQEAGRQIASLLLQVPDDLRGQTFLIVAEELRKNTQFYTASLMAQAATQYGFPRSKA